MTLTEDRSQANVFVVVDVSEPCRRTSLAAAARGGIVCNIQYILKRGSQGPAVVYTKGVQVRRIIYCSEGFRGGHPQMYDLIQSLASQRGSRWALELNKSARSGRYGI